MNIGNGIGKLWGMIVPRELNRNLTVLLGAAAVAGSAMAGSVTYTAEKELDFTDWSVELSLPRFDGSLGNLTRVIVTMEGENETQTKLENLGRRQVTFVTASQVTLSAWCQSATIASVVPRVAFTNVLQGFDGVSDFAGASGVENPVQLESAESSRELFPGVDDLTCFLGQGNFPFSATAVASGTVSGSADYDFEVVTKAAVRISVTYEYDEVIQLDPILGSIGDRVWKDSNANGIQEANEPGLVGWTVTLLQGGVAIGSKVTGPNGIYLFTDLPAGIYTVRVTPKSGYTQTYDLDGLGTLHVATAALAEGEERLDVDFGYVCFKACIPSGTGCTPGFWSNQNGQALIRPSDLAVLTSLRLVDGSGRDVDMMDPVTLNFGGNGPASLAAGKTLLRGLLLNTSASNMAAQLSRHLAAFTLNTHYGFIRTSATFRFNGQTYTATQLIALADASLQQHPLTPSKHSARAYQSALKDVLDAANNAARR